MAIIELKLKIAFKFLQSLRRNSMYVHEHQILPKYSAKFQYKKSPWPGFGLIGTVVLSLTQLLNGSKF